jgi:WhiB family transcriptional regulator, redox-sensing transcriptional regulator
MSWEHQARCSEHDPDLFFVPRVALERRAKTICSRCPVKTDCLAFALDSRMEFGIWGGLNEKERRSMLRRGAAGGGWREVVEEDGRTALAG